MLARRSKDFAEMDGPWWLGNCSKMKNARVPHLHGHRRSRIFFSASETERNAARRKQAGRKPVCREAHARALNSGAARPGVRIQLHETRARPRPRRDRTIARPDARSTKAVAFTGQGFRKSA